MIGTSSIIISSKVLPTAYEIAYDQLRQIKVIEDNLAGTPTGTDYLEPEDIQILFNKIVIFE